MVLMFYVRQPGRQLAFMMVIDQRDDAHHLPAGIPGFPDQRLPDQVANGFRPVGKLVRRDIAVELLQQIMFQ